MHLDIEDSSLESLLQNYKDYIGESWVNGVVNIIGGCSFIVTIYSAKLVISGVEILLYIIAILLVIIGTVQVWRGTGKRKFDCSKLFADIKKLSTTESQYSLAAIVNSFEGEGANKVLLRCLKDNWKTYMFLSYRTASEKDEHNIKSRVAADLKIPRNQIEVKFLTEIPYQPKYSPDLKSRRMYHNIYYQVFIRDFPDKLKQSKFILDGAKYKWMTVQEMWEDNKIRENNADVLQVFEKYIFNTEQEPPRMNADIHKSVYIRLNRVCDLHCAFCLADEAARGLTLGQIKRILNTLSSQGVEVVKLTGGEPTLRPDFFEILDYCTELGMGIVLYSNLYTAADIIDSLKHYSISVATSIHGDENFHDKITKKGAYKKTYENVVRLTKANIPVTIHMVVMSKNYMLAEDVIKEAINAGVKKVTFQTLIPREKGADLFKAGENQLKIQEKFESLYILKPKYESKIEIGFSNLYEKDCYVVETDGMFYLEKGKDSVRINNLI